MAHTIISPSDIGGGWMHMFVRSTTLSIVVPRRIVQVPSRNRQLVCASRKACWVSTYQREPRHSQYVGYEIRLHQLSCNVASYIPLSRTRWCALSIPDPAFRYALPVQITCTDLVAVVNIEFMRPSL